MSPEYLAWYEAGRQAGYISKVYCDIHDLRPLTEEELRKVSNEEEVCVFVVRMYGHGTEGTPK